MGGLGSASARSGQASPGAERGLAESEAHSDRINILKLILDLVFLPMDEWHEDKLKTL